MPVAGDGVVARYRRARRFALADWRRRNAVKLDSKGAASCMRSYGDAVVAVSTDRRAHVGGEVRRCGSIAACPICGPVIRERRAAEIDEACAAHLASGGSLWFATFTVPHRLGESLTEVMDRVQDCWRMAWLGRAGSGLRRSLGVVGMIRSWDITWSSRNGWHPHLHVLFFVESSWLDGGALAEAWRVSFDRLGLDYVPGVSCDWSEVRNAGDSAGYLTKVDRGWGAGLELARTDLKRGRGVTVPQLLEMAADGEAVPVALWVEYERSTRGRRMIQWTPGLRARLGLGEQVDDEEAAEGPAPTEVAEVYVFEADAWNRYRATGRLAWVLTLCELGSPVVGSYRLTAGGPGVAPGSASLRADVLT